MKGLGEGKLLSKDNAGAMQQRTGVSGGDFSEEGARRRVENFTYRGLEREGESSGGDLRLSTEISRRKGGQPIEGKGRGEEGGDLGKKQRAFPQWCRKTNLSFEKAWEKSHDAERGNLERKWCTRSSQTLTIILPRKKGRRASECGERKGKLRTASYREEISAGGEKTNLCKGSAKECSSTARK